MSDSPRDNAEGGLPGVNPADDDEVDLGISLQAVANIIDAARAAEGLDDPETASDDQEPFVEDANEQNVTGENLGELITELNEDEQASLIALTWVGRGDYEPDEWKEALRLAHERNEGGGTADYLMGMEMLGDLLSEGLAAFGIVVEEIER
ncbi:DUF3775 domain-containing protein [Roseomonas sp. CCTCC AB2023176]|uniref:DUF3775 domain-containing protein n=1 Tax=Roseomonas sp. CCTCC AB2023176 TaxID=3342640 RepID=UPI0035DC2B4A